MMVKILKNIIGNWPIVMITKILMEKPILMMMYLLILLLGNMPLDKCLDKVYISGKLFKECGGCEY